MWDILKSAEVTGNVLTLTEQLPKKKYAKIKAALKRLGCEWKGGQHIFIDGFDATAWENVLARKKLPTLNPLAYFPTPPSGIELIKLYIQDSINPFRTNLRMLEPSAGSGALIDLALSLSPSIIVDAVEADPYLADRLRGRYKDNPNITIHNMRFEEFQSSEKYDVVLMNPPFSGNLYAKHIMRAATMTKHDGEICFVAPKTLTLSSIGAIKKLAQRLGGTTYSAEYADDVVFDGTNVETMVCHWHPHYNSDTVESVLLAAKNNQAISDGVAKAKTVDEAKGYLERLSLQVRKEMCWFLPEITSKLTVDVLRNWGAPIGAHLPITQQVLF